jgi:hypothetical protein
MGPNVITGLSDDRNGPSGTGLREDMMIASGPVISPTVLLQKVDDLVHLHFHISAQK